MKTSENASKASHECLLSQEQSARGLAVQSFSEIIQSAINAEIKRALAELPEIPSDYPREDEDAKSYADAISEWRFRLCERAANG